MTFDVGLASALFDEQDDVDGGVWRRLAAFVEDQGPVGIGSSMP